MSDSDSKIQQAVKDRALLVFGFVGVLWFVEVFNILLGGTLSSWGIRPRSISGLLGIPLAPFLHSGIHHLLSNSLALIPLAFLVSARRLEHLFSVTTLVTFLGGGAVWLLGRGSLHIGASGLVFGYIGFLLLSGWFERSFVSIAVSLFVGFSYGGMTLLGLLPIFPGVSWESHLFGFAAGILSARLLANRN